MQKFIQNDRQNMHFSICVFNHQQREKKYDELNEKRMQIYANF